LYEFAGFSPLKPLRSVPWRWIGKKKCNVINSGITKRSIYIFM